MEIFSLRYRSQCLYSPAIFPLLPTVLTSPKKYLCCSMYSQIDRLLKHHNVPPNRSVCCPQSFYPALQTLLLVLIGKAEDVSLRISFLPIQSVLYVSIFCLLLQSPFVLVFQPQRQNNPVRPNFAIYLFHFSATFPVFVRRRSQRFSTFSPALVLLNCRNIEDASSFPAPACLNCFSVLVCPLDISCLAGFVFRLR